MPRLAQPSTGRAREHIAGIDVALAEGERIRVLGIGFSVIEVPGHTAGHIAYSLTTSIRAVLFCGDTLFAGGCGRLFEGTPTQMLGSLDQARVAARRDPYVLRS